MNNRTSTFVAAVVPLLLFSGCGSSDSTPANTNGASKDIVDTAVAAGSFTTLTTALTSAGLVQTLKGPGPFTVFAPTDAAFGKLPAGTVDTLLMPANHDQLTAVLTYHVVAGEQTKADLAKVSTIKTVEGQNLAISATGGAVKVNEANVTTADIACSNGVIHVIDSVLLPPAQ
jgi:uncharacterized surface protein with fasciclin (FAS1) repeats